MAIKQCVWEGCEALAAYSTRTKPAWCDEHITEQLRQGGLEPLEPFTGPGDWRLTRCLTCGCEAHYRLLYTLDKNTDREPTCRACYWAKWTADALKNGWVPGGAETGSDDQLRELCQATGYDYLGPAPLPPSYRVRCRYCGRISAERTGDIEYGCACQFNRPRANMTKPQAAMLRDSQAARLWWDFDNNSPGLWETATERTMRSASWKCPECGLHFEARIREMYGTAKCPDCAARERDRRRAEWELALVTPVSTVPELVARWADEESPDVAMLGGWRLRRFLCENGHYARVSPHSYLADGCPACRGQATLQGNIERRSAMTDAERAAERLGREPAELWHPTRNAPRKAGDLRGGRDMARPAWWLAPECGHEWEAPPGDFMQSQRLRCPECRSILDSLAWHFPDLAAEWSPDNPLSAWHVRPNATLPFIPEWICSTDPAHRWRIASTVRVHGSTCPLCRESGKSMVELRHFDALRSAFGEAFSGLAMRSEAFARRSVWVPDVTVQLDGGRTLLVEYDGSYWHADKADVDLDKSRDLLAAGALVVRLREWPLPSLGLDSRDYLELLVSSTAPDPDAAVSAIREWLDGRP
jgi:ssDNA-binding Zn-finger/Zn-ribbon topoisomerase 1